MVQVSGLDDVELGVLKHAQVDTDTCLDRVRKTPRYRVSNVERLERALTHERRLAASRYERLERIAGHHKEIAESRQQLIESLGIRLARYEGEE